MPVKTYHPKDSPFKVIYVDITHPCQMSCANCYLPNRNIPDMDLKAFSACISQLPRKTDLRLIGGEPTLRSDLHEIIGLIRSFGHRPLLITNGLKLANDEYVLSLKNAGLDYAQISLNGYNDNSIYKVIDKMECADQKMKAVENCVRLGISASLSCILVRDLNTHLVADLIDYAETLPKPVRINFRNVGAIGRNMTSEVKSLSLIEIADLVAEKLNLKTDVILQSKVASNQIVFRSKLGKRYSQQVIIKITDWSIFQENDLVDPKSLIRGRITQDFRLAPHFEHIKENEFGY